MGNPTISVARQRGRWLAVTAAVLGWMFDGFEMGLFPLAARPALGELLRPGVEASLPPGVEVQAALDAAVGWWFAVVTASFLFGAAAGGAVFGWLGDRVGRSRALLFSVLTYTLLTGLGGFATSAWQMAVLRFLAALGMGGEWSLGVALVMEVWPTSARPYLAAVIGAAGNLGYLMVGALSLTIDHFQADPSASWRPLLWCGAAPAVLCLVIRLFVPESDQWRKATASGQRSTPLELFSPRLARRTVVAVGLMSVALLGTWGAVQWVPTWTASMTEKANADLPPAEAKSAAKRAAATTQMVSAGGACVGAGLASVAAWRFGRRPTYFVLCLASLGATAWLFRATPAFGPSFFALVFAVGAVSASFYGWAPLYLPELFPTRLRATGQGVAFNLGRVAAGVGTLALTGATLDGFRRDYAASLAVTSLIYVVGPVLIWLAPETRGEELPD